MYLKTIKIICWCCAILLWGCGDDEFTSPDDPKFDAEPEGLTLNTGTTFQIIDHFGASDAWSAEWVGRWPDASKEPLAELLFSTEMDTEGNPKGIGLTNWRFNIGEGAGEQDDSGYRPQDWKRETECFLDEDGVTYDWTEQAGSQWFLQKAREYGVNKFTAWTNCPPYFMTKNEYTFRTTEVPSYNLKEDSYEAFAAHLATVMKHFNDEGFNFNVLTPINEPQYEWRFNVGEATQSGSKALNSETAAIVRALDAQFTEQGIEADIMIPEAGQLRYLYEGSLETENQADDFFTESSPNYVGDLPHISANVAGHSYFSNPTIAESVGQRKSLRDKLQSIGNLNFWQTEYSLLGADYQQGRDVASLQPIDYALWLSRIVQIDLVHGNATGWDFWTAMNNSTFGDHSNRFNLILWQPNVNGPEQTDGTYEIVKNFWAYGNFSRFIRPGMVRFEVLDSAYDDELDAAQNFLVSGFLDTASNEVVLVCFNAREEERIFPILNYGDGFSVEGDTFTAYTTSASNDLRKSELNHDAITIPPKAIVTLTGKLQ